MDPFYSVRGVTAVGDDMEHPELQRRALHLLRSGVAVRESPCNTFADWR